MVFWYTCAPKKGSGAFVSCFCVDFHLMRFKVERFKVTKILIEICIEKMMKIKGSIETSILECGFLPAQE